jgi:aromatase
MTELRIWTARHSIRVAAPPKRVFELAADIDRWPGVFDAIEAVEHLGFDGMCERVRVWKRIDGVSTGWRSVRELNPKRLQMRFRQVDFPPPFASMGGLLAVVPKGTGSVVALDHYYRVVDDRPATVAQAEHEISTNSVLTLNVLRQTAERDMADFIAEGKAAS